MRRVEQPRGNGNVMSNAQGAAGLAGRGHKRGRDQAGGGRKKILTGSANANNNGNNGGGTGGGGNAGARQTNVYTSPAEMQARYAAGVCQFCGQAGHHRKQCTNGKSLNPSFAGQGQNGNN